MLVLIVVKGFSKNGKIEAKSFHVYKEKQNVKVDIGHKWSSEKETLLVLCQLVHSFLLTFYFCCNKKK